MILNYSVFTSSASTYTFSVLPQRESAAFQPGAVHVALSGLAALAIAMGIGRFAFTPILPMMQEDLGVSLPEGGWLASANYLGYFVGALSAIGMRVKPVSAIRAGLLIIGLSTLGMALEHEFWLWLVLRLLAGIASAWVLVFVSSLALGRLSALGHSQLGGVVYAGVGVGIVAAGMACLALMGLRASSSDAWITLGLAALGASGLIWRSIQPATPPGESPKSEAESTVWSAQCWWLVLCYGAFGFGYIIPATFLPVMAREIVADPALFGWAWPVFGAAAVVSTLLAAHAATWLTHRGVWIFGNLAMALGVVFPVVVPGLGGILAAAFFVGGTFMVITMAGMQEARRLAGARARPLMAVMTSAFALGQIIGPLSVAYLIKVGGDFAAALVLASALLALSAIALRATSGFQTVSERTEGIKARTWGEKT